MMVSDILTGNSIMLRCAHLTYCPQAYVDWLNAPEVNQYLETRWETQTLESVIDYVQMMRSSQNNILVNIITKDSEKHIGNMKNWAN